MTTNNVYAGYITAQLRMIGIYIGTLNDIFQTVAGYQLHLEKFDIADYMDQIKARANSSYALQRNLSATGKRGLATGCSRQIAAVGTGSIDVISNALNHSPPRDNFI